MKIAFVVQRYGMEVNGGAELSCRLIAEHLSNEFEIEVLTTCAKDYVTWKNEYDQGPQKINNVLVRRFPVDKERDIEEFNSFSNKIFEQKEVSKKDELAWVHKQGPDCQKLLDYIEKNKTNYDFFVFYTYLYYPTVLGLPLVADKSILVPTAHDEMPIRLNVYKPVFKKPRAIIYHSAEEQDFVTDLFHNEQMKSAVIGTGINMPNSVVSAKEFFDKYRMKDFIMYAGRLEEAKGLRQLFDYFMKYVDQSSLNTKLVLFGKGSLEVPRHPNIVHFGYVSEKDKYDAIAASKIVIIPSELESLSITSLEAWSLRKPIMANGLSAVLKGSCNRSNGGLFYVNYEEFKDCLNLLLSNNKLSNKLGDNGRKYVTSNYDWPVIKSKYVTLLKSIKNQR